MKRKKQQQQNKQKQQQHIKAPGGHAIKFTSQVDMLSNYSTEWSADRTYIPCPTVTIVK